MTNILTSDLNKKTLAQRPASQQESPVRRTVLSFISEANNTSEIEQLEIEKQVIKDTFCKQFEDLCPQLYSKFINTDDMQEKNNIIKKNTFLLKIRDEALDQLRLLSKKISPIKEEKHTHNDNVLFLHDIKNEDMLIRHDTSDMEAKFIKLPTLK